MMIKKFLFVFTCVLLGNIWSVAWAESGEKQQITITVTDENGMPLRGVYVGPSVAGWLSDWEQTDSNGRMNVMAQIGDTVVLERYCSPRGECRIDSANQTCSLDLHWFDGMQPGDLREIDCTDSNNTAVCYGDNTKTGIIGLNYESDQVCHITLECKSGYEWYLDGGEVECREGAGAASVTIFSEIADKRCKGLTGQEYSECLACTTRDWRAWNWVNKACSNNNGDTSQNSQVSGNIDTIKAQITKTAGELNSIKFDKSRWKTASGNFNGARLASDSIAGVVLGTAGGLITSTVIKNNQLKGGFEDIQCVINGQVVSGYLDEFVVGIK